MCLFSTLFAVYLIVYFAFIIGFYREMKKDQSVYRTNSESVSYGLASTQLAMAGINVLLSFVGIVISGRAIALCVPKGVFYDEIQPISSPIPHQTYQNRIGF